MKVTRAEIVAVIRTTDRRHTSDDLDRERFLAPNDLATRLRSTSRETREYLLHYLVGSPEMSWGGSTSFAWKRPASRHPVTAFGQAGKMAPASIGCRCARWARRRR